MIKKITLIFCLLVAGCASHIGSNWQCPNPTAKGSPCVNIAQADSQSKKQEKEDTQDKNPINRNVTDHMVKAAAISGEKLEKPQETLALNNLKEEPVRATTGIAPELPYIEEKYEVALKRRTTESVARVWFAPFIDKYNNRHEESIIYVVDQESSWRKE